MLMGKLTISTGPCSMSQTVSLPEGKSSVCSTIHKLPTDVDHCRPTHGATAHFRPAAASVPTLSSRSQSSGASTSTSSRRPDSAMVAKEGQKSAESVGWYELLCYIHIHIYIYIHVNQSINQSVNQSISQSINQSIYLYVMNIYEDYLDVVSDLDRWLIDWLIDWLVGWLID